MDDNQNQGGANGAPPAGNPPADAGKPAAGAEPAAPSHRDWNALASNLRELTSTVKVLAELQNKGAVTAPAPASKPDTKPQSAPEPASGNSDAAMARIQELERNLALRDAFLEHGISDPEARELIAAKVRLDNAADVGVVVAKYAAKFKPATPAQATPAAEVKPAPPAVTAGTAGTGVGGAPARTQQPNDILAVDPAYWQSLTNEQKREFWEKKQKGVNSVNHNPFAAGKRAPK